MSTKVNWANGLFRIWIVLSIMWIALMSAIIRPDIAVREYVQLTSRAVEIKSEWKLDEVSKPAPEFGGVVFIPVELEEVETQAEIRLQSIRGSLAQILLPPLFSFLIGVSLIWALKGFRHSPKI